MFTFLHLVHSWTQHSRYPIYPTFPPSLFTTLYTYQSAGRNWRTWRKAATSLFLFHSKITGWEVTGVSSQQVLKGLLWISDFIPYVAFNFLFSLRKTKFNRRDFTWHKKTCTICTPNRWNLTFQTGQVQDRPL